MRAVGLDFAAWILPPLHRGVDVLPDPSTVLPPDSPAALAFALGCSKRSVVPRGQHGDWAPVPDRHDPVEMICSSNEGRLPDLVPIRIGRMLASPFAFLRGSAALMAADLATTPSLDSYVQLCGDAHLVNFGMYASPERRLVFDLNDFDETVRGPWEWDLKRLAASFVVASRENGFPDATSRDIARIVGAQYRRWIRTYASMRALEVWYGRSRSSRSSTASNSRVPLREGEPALRSRSRMPSERTTWPRWASCRPGPRTAAG